MKIVKVFHSSAPDFIVLVPDGVEDIDQFLDSVLYGASGWQEAEELRKNVEYNPTAIGTAILRARGYEVKEYLKGDISVKDSSGKVLYFSDLPYCE